MIRIILVFLFSTQLLAVHNDEPKTFKIPQIIHGIWVGPNPIPMEFKENVIDTAVHFPDFDVHLWTSSENVNPAEWPVYDNLNIHTKNELNNLFLYDKNYIISEEFNDYIEHGLYAGAKDIFAHLLMYLYGGIVFDLDCHLKPTIREFVSESTFSYFCPAITPMLLASIPQGIFPKTALEFFKKHSFSLKNDPEIGHLIEGIKKDVGFYYVYATSGTLVGYTNRILRLGTSDVNFHNHSLYLTCQQCEKFVFTAIDENMAHADDFLQNANALPYYVDFLDTPSSLTRTELTPDAIRFCSRTNQIGFMVFQSFLTKDEQDKFYDCWGDK